MDKRFAPNLPWTTSTKRDFELSVSMNEWHAIEKAYGKPIPTSSDDQGSDARRKILLICNEFFGALEAEIYSSQREGRATACCKRS